MRFESLDDWLAWQETLHPAEIELGLERVARVVEALGLGDPGFAVVTVGGTNGKGSVCAFVDAILRADGRRVGVYRSPHLLRYNERIVIDGVEVTDEALCRAFERVDRARGEISLTYFEFGTLAAFVLFAERRVAVAVLEVGLGGRLDAVNVLDPDVAVVTSVGIDHQAWLGEDREAIGREKAGIFRGGRPAVCGDPEPPRSLLDYARAIGARLQRIGGDFRAERREGGWDWIGPQGTWRGLPLPALDGTFQLTNAATALTALAALPPTLRPSRDAVEQGMAAVSLPGRFQRRTVAGVQWIVDVGHNPHAARALAEALCAEPVAGRTLAVVAMLGDKDAAGTVAEMAVAVDDWFVAGLAVPRGLDAATLVARMGVPVEGSFGGVAEAIAAARAAARAGDRVVVFGSFHTVAEALRVGV